MSMCHVRGTRLLASSGSTCIQWIDFAWHGPLDADVGAMVAERVRCIFVVMPAFFFAPRKGEGVEQYCACEDGIQPMNCKPWPSHSLTEAAEQSRVSRPRFCFLRLFSLRLRRAQIREVNKQAKKQIVVIPLLSLFLV